MVCDGQCQLFFAGEFYLALSSGAPGNWQSSGVAAGERRVVALGWTEAGLSQRAKGDPGTVTLARRLWAETTMKLAWIADRTKIGSWTHVSNRLNEEPD